MNNIINMNSQIKRIITLDDTSKANELNMFFLSFETHDFSKERAEGPGNVPLSLHGAAFFRNLLTVTLYPPAETEP